MQVNALSAVLYALIGILTVVLAVMTGFCIMRAKAERKNLERYVYVREHTTESGKVADRKNDRSNKAR